jgi:tetratricopeptide (TPR) repeat protein
VSWPGFYSILLYSIDLSMDYSRFDAIAAEEIAAEKSAALEKRRFNREKYYQEQEDKKVQWLKENNTQQNPHETQNHHHQHNHQHNHEHSHDNEAVVKNSAAMFPPRPSCGCGFMDPERLAQLKAQAENPQPEISVEEKNQKKFAAIEACREHGKQLFNAQEYKEAIAVYERGILIVTGLYGLKDEKKLDYLNDVEVIFNLNTALCHFKLKNWLECINACILALQLDEKNIKVLYRLACCHMELQEYEKATEYLDRALSLQPDNADCKKAKQRIVEMKKRDEVKEKVFQHQMIKKLKEQQAQVAAQEKEKPAAVGTN